MQLLALPAAQQRYNKITLPTPTHRDRAHLNARQDTHILNGSDGRYDP